MDFFKSGSNTEAASKDKTVETSQVAKETTGEVTETPMEKATKVKDSAVETAVAAKDKTVDVAKTATENATNIGKAAMETAQEGKDNTVEVLSSTGEQVKKSTLGAPDAVKNTLGMGTKK